jgi:CHAT domain-containing protein
LPGAIEEITAIAKLRPDCVSKVGLEFDRAAVRSALQGRAALHIATHLKPGCGLDRGRLADVGLELSQGDSFCARQVFELRPRLPLVVIDACETAEGRFVDAEGLQGIARAFLESGTRGLVVTLWPVRDLVARDFAIAFHRALLDGGTVSRATSTARQELRAAGAGPADWSAFRAIARD